MKRKSYATLPLKKKSFYVYKSLPDFRAAGLFFRFIELLCPIWTPPGGLYARLRAREISQSTNSKKD
jgi:hypothetical protein